MGWSIKGQGEVEGFGKVRGFVEDLERSGDLGRWAC